MTNWTREREAAARARCEAATEGTWSTGPTTGAGDVWVYARGEPLAEPTHWLPRLFLPFKMFNLRTDSYPKLLMPWLREKHKEWEPKGWGEGANRDKYWIQKQNDARFIAHARTDLPDALDEIQRLREVLIDVWTHELTCPCSPRLNTNVAPLDECNCGLNEALHAPEGE